MKTFILLAAATALSVSAGAYADPGHGRGRGHEQVDGNRDAGCPPGLAKKHNGCMPPGQARKFGRGQRWESGYGTPYSYGQIPYRVRQQYSLSARYRYYYDNGTLYAVNPRTMLIAQVISALLR